jgi:hypothetical protein
MVDMLRRALAALALVPLAACSSSAPARDTAAPAPTTGATTAAAQGGAGPSASASAVPGGGRTTPAAVSTSGTGSTGGSGSTGTAGSGTTGGTAAALGTPSGTYTYDSSGTQTVSGAKQDVQASSTLTMGALANGRQTSTLHNSQGDTTQEIEVRSTGDYLAALTVSSPTLKTAFHLSPAALLLPDPARVGASWSWNGTSDDGKTTVATTNKVLRTETVTIGGESVATVVLQSHLVITGQDVHYTADATNWVAQSYRLPVKTRTTGSGSYGAFPFSFDVTDVLRSVHPS